MLIRLGINDYPSMAGWGSSALQRYANNRNIWLKVRDVFQHPYTMEQARAFLAFVAGQKPQTIFAIANGSEAIGCIGLTLGGDVHPFTAELGYWLGETFWGRGIMSEAGGRVHRLGIGGVPVAPDLCAAIRNQCGVSANSGEGGICVRRTIVRECI